MTVATTYGVGTYRATEGYMLLTDKRGTTNYHGVIACHGHGASAVVFQPGTFVSAHVEALARARHSVLSVDAAGPTAWANDTAMAALDDAYTYLRGLGAPVKVGLIGWSMGGLTALNWLKRNPAKVDRVTLWAPAVNLAYHYPLDTAEINAAYGGVTAAQFAGHDPQADALLGAYTGLGATVDIYHGALDVAVPIAHSAAFVAACADPNVRRYVAANADHVTIFDAFPSYGPDSIVSRMAP